MNERITRTLQVRLGYEYAKRTAIETLAHIPHTTHIHTYYYNTNIHTYPRPPPPHTQTETDDRETELDNV
jgi:hypothetical protein